MHYRTNYRILGSQLAFGFMKNDPASPSTGGKMDGLS
jgi:hypothetical protein